jgi:hypothetical protein
MLGEITGVEIIHLMIRATQQSVFERDAKPTQRTFSICYPFTHQSPKRSLTLHFGEWKAVQYVKIPINDGVSVSAFFLFPELIG